MKDWKDVWVSSADAPLRIGVFRPCGTRRPSVDPADFSFLMRNISKMPLNQPSVPDGGLGGRAETLASMPNMNGRIGNGLCHGWNWHSIALYLAGGGPVCECS